MTNLIKKALVTISLTIIFISLLANAVQSLLNQPDTTLNWAGFLLLLLGVYIYPKGIKFIYNLLWSTNSNSSCPSCSCHSSRPPAAPESDQDTSASK